MENMEGRNEVTQFYYDNARRTQLLSLRSQEV